MLPTRFAASIRILQSRQIVSARVRPPRVRRSREPAHPSPAHSRSNYSAQLATVLTGCAQSALEFSGWAHDLGKHPSQTGEAVSQLVELVHFVWQPTGSPRERPRKRGGKPRVARAAPTPGERAATHTRQSTGVRILAVGRPLSRPRPLPSFAVSTQTEDGGAVLSCRLGCACPYASTAR